jgi:WD40 repeat protein
MLVLKTRRQVLEQVLFTADGVGLAVAGKLGAFWWKAFADGAKPIRIGEKECGGVGFGPEGRYLIAGLYKSGSFTTPEVHIIGLGETTHTIPVTGYHAPIVAACPKTGAFLVDDTYNNQLTCWEPPNGKEPVRRWSLKPGQYSICSRLVFAPDGSWFARAEKYSGRSPNIYDMVFRSPETGKVIRDFEAAEWVSCGPAISADAQWLAFGFQSRVVVMRCDGPGKVAYLPNDNTHQFTGVAFHPSGKYLATTNNDKVVKLYDTKTWKIAKSFTWEIGRMRSVTFSPDGTLAAAGSDSGKVIIWDVDL